MLNCFQFCLNFAFNSTCAATLWAVRSDGTLNGVAVDGANAVVAAGGFSSSSATFGGVALNNVNTGFSDAVVWKVSVLLLSCVNVACVSSTSIYILLLFRHLFWDSHRYSPSSSLYHRS